MIPRTGWWRFAAWVFAGGADALRLAHGLLDRPVRAALRGPAIWLVARKSRIWPEILGLVGGAGVILLVVAALNHEGPGCRTTAASPAPSRSRAAASTRSRGSSAARLLAVGPALYALARRRSSNRPSRVTIARMGTFSTRFLGCKVSQTDVQAIRERLIADGHVEASGDDRHRRRERLLRHARGRAQVAPGGPPRRPRTARKVYVTGCGANLRGAWEGLPAEVTVVALPSERTPAFVAGDVGAVGCVRDDVGLDRIRAFVKVQDGCSFSCAFCVVPQVRGASRSRPAERVLAEIHRRVEQGHREVVLTGINLGCYRDRAAGLDLPGLVRAAGATPGLARLRLSSVEVNHVTDGLIAAMRETPRWSRHLHVPLQSGDDRVLRAMKRRYTAATYLRRVGRADGFNLTTDAIVGFPEEDDAAFDATLRVVSEAGITKVHVFPYSPRPGTDTAEQGHHRPAGEARSAAPACAPPPARPAAAAGPRAWAPRTRCSSTAREPDTATTTLPGSSTPQSATSCASAPSGWWRRESSVSQPDCPFCRLVANGDHVRAGGGFVAVRDIAPKAPVHLLVIPERHVETFRDVSLFEPDEAQRMLAFVRRDGARGRARGLSRGRQRGRGRRPDRVPPALARPRRRNPGRLRMTLITELEDELTEAMKAGDESRRDTLRLVLSELRSAEKELQRPLDESEELQVLQRERKKRVEAADAFRKAGRDEQADTEELELEVIEEFMPEPIDEEELERIVDDAIAETGATSST